MNLERRLQHAARELREIPIEVPPLASGIRQRRRSLVPALAAPLLFAAGALFAVGAVRGVERPVHSDISAATTLGTAASEPARAPAPDVVSSAADQAETADVTADGGSDGIAPSIHEELQMISDFLAQSQARLDREASESAAGSADPVGGGPI